MFPLPKITPLSCHISFRLKPQGYITILESFAREAWSEPRGNISHGCSLYSSPYMCNVYVLQYTITNIHDITVICAWTQWSSVRLQKWIKIIQKGHWIGRTGKWRTKKDQRPENAGPEKWRTRVHQSRQVMTLFESKQQAEFKSWRWVEFRCRHQTTESGES